MACAHDLWLVVVGVVLQRWYCPTALLRLDVTQDHFEILLMFSVVGEEVDVAVETVLGDAVGFCFVSHNLSFIVASVIAANNKYLTARKFDQQSNEQGHLISISGKSAAICCHCDVKMTFTFHTGLSPVIDLFHVKIKERFTLSR